MLVPAGPFRKIPIGGNSALIPSNLPLLFPHLEEYYDMRLQAVQADNSVIHSYTDWSGNGRHSTDTGTPGGPTYQSDASNRTPKGVNTAFFSVAGSTALGSGTINPYPTDTRGQTFYSYALRSNTGAAVEWQDDTGGRPQLVWNFQPNNKLGWRDSSNHEIAFVAPYQSKFVQLCWAFDDANSICYVYANGNLLGSGASNLTSQAVGATIIGSNQVFNASIDCLHAHFLWYSAYHPPPRVALFALWSHLYFGNQ